MSPNLLHLAGNNGEGAISEEGKSHQVEEGLILAQENESKPNGDYCTTYVDLLVVLLILVLHQIHRVVNGAGESEDNHSDPD